jgi:hypothetical protein
MDNTTTKPKVTGADFFLYLGCIVTFYVFIITYATFLFSLINTFFPDRQYNYYDPYGTGMRLSVSMLVVATPLFIFLLKKIYTKLRSYPLENDLWIRKWGLYLTLFLSIAALAIDLVVLINTFLGGEISTRFTFKALIILIIGAVVWWHTKQELHNNIAVKPKLAKGLGIAVIVVVLASVVTGFYFIGSPTLLRNIRDDNQRESDLTNIRGQVVNYYQSKNGVLPNTLADVNLGNPYPQDIPNDPETGSMYGYKILESKKVGTSTFPTFELCATFKEDNSVDERVQGAGSISQPSYDSMGGYNGSESGFSKHAAGDKCFEVNIDPQRFDGKSGMK